MRNLREVLGDSRADWTHPFTMDAINARRQFWIGLKEEDRTKLNGLLRTAIKERNDLIEKNASHYAVRLELDTPVSASVTLERLLRKLEQAREHRSLRRWFEACFLFDITVAMWYIDKQDPDDAALNDLSEITDLFERELFEPDPEVVDVLVRASHSKRYFRVAEGHALLYRVEDGRVLTDLRVPRTEPRSYEWTCRLLRGHPALVYFRPPRLKSRFGIALKILKQLEYPRPPEEGKPPIDPFEIGDRCGLKLVIPTMADLSHVEAALWSVLHKVGGTMSPFKGNMRRAAQGGPVTAADFLNGSSSKDFRVEKADIWWLSRMFEIQVQTCAAFLSAEHGWGRENWAVYRLEQCLLYYFPLLVPSLVYGYDWRQGGVRRRLRADMIESLKTRARQTA